MARTKVDTPDWVIHLDEAVTRVSRAARSPRLHQMMGRRARVELGDHLHLTLALLGAGQPMRVSELAEQLDVERSTVSRRVSQLIDQGLVVRSVDEKDHRAALLSLTLPGRRALARIQDAWRQTLLELTGGWRDRDRAETTSRLSRLADGLETLLAG